MAALSARPAPQDWICRKRHDPGLRLPNLIIAGAQKSGTSSLHAWLAHHPQCAMSQPKEPMLFNRPCSAVDLGRYASCFCHETIGPDVRIIGEASTPYLSLPDVPARIADLLGTAVKLVFVLRNPAERAVSAYWHMAKRLHELRPLAAALSVATDDPVTALRIEREKLCVAENTHRIRTDGYEASVGDRHWCFRYLRNGFYLDDLQRFQKEFGRRNMLVLLTDDLAVRPVESFRRVAQFLSISGDLIPSSVGSRHNVTRVPRQSRGMAALYAVLRRMPRSMEHFRRALLTKFSEEMPAVPPQVAGSLVRLFSAHNRRLSEWLERDLSAWSELPLFRHAG